MNIFEKFKFLLKKPKVVIVTGNGRACAKEAIFQVLNQYFKIGKEILIFETAPHHFGKNHYNPNKSKKFRNPFVEFLIKHSSLPVLVVTQIGDIPFAQDYFAGEKEEAKNVQKLAKLLPYFGYLILNFDDETVREIADITNLKTFTFGFQEGTAFQATDIKLNSGTNFKVNYNGNVVPIWLEKLFGKEQIYSALAAAVVGTILDLNLVEISQALKNYQSLPGKMRLIEGIKHSWILDNSESETIFSMIEALEILGKLEGFKRKVAVLADIVRIGEYTIEAHETVGERVARNADSLFTFGPRAKFITQGAQEKGMAIDRIFEFDTIEQGKLKLQDEIKEGDLILVDGSKEMKMREIVEEIKI